jgi:hypothetical protein
MKANIGDKIYIPDILSAQSHSIHNGQFYIS